MSYAKQVADRAKKDLERRANTLADEIETRQKEIDEIDSILAGIETGSKSTSPKLAAPSPRKPQAKRIDPAASSRQKPNGVVRDNAERGIKIRAAIIKQLQELPSDAWIAPRDIEGASPRQLRILLESNEIEHNGKMRTAARYRIAQKRDKGNGRPSNRDRLLKRLSDDGPIARDEIVKYLDSTEQSVQGLINDLVRDGSVNVDDDDKVGLV